MNREIDERIVAMHFNNEDFERNAKQSIKTLEELKKGLDLEGAAEGFSNISKIASNKMGLQPATKQVGLFSKSLSAMGKVAKSAFGMVTSPIQSVANGFGTLNKYVRAVAGFDIAGKLVSTLENTFREFTIAPLETGFNEYELKMDSIKTIMTGTANEFRKAMGEAYTEEGHLEKVKNALEELNVYADKTIYSFKDMTSNIGKFTNNGVALDAAVKSMQGIANAAALAGQGTQQASMAMYNLSQAIGVGKLTTIDWKSIENANMATLEFKQAFIDVAAAAGNLTKVSETYFTKENQNTLNTLKKKKELTDAEKKELAALEERKKVNDDYNNLKKQKKLTDEQKQELALLEKKVNENGKYYTKEEAAEIKALKAKKKRTKAEDERLKKLEKEGEITAENFRNTLSKGWADADIITHVLEIFGGELDEDILRAWGITDPEQIKYFIELGEKAKQAATEVRTFSKMMDALKEAAQSGWAISFEYIFGDMKEATALWTEINDKISGVLNKSAEARNNLLLGWRGKEKRQNEKGEWEIVDIEGALDGREILIDSLRNIFQIVEKISGAFSKAKEAIFGNLSSDYLVELTQKFEQFTKKILVWLDTSDGSETNLEKLQKGFRGVLSVLNMFWKSFKRGLSFVKTLAGPLIDFFVKVFGVAGEFTEDLTKDGLIAAIGKLYDKFKSLTKEKVSEWFRKIGDSVKELWSKLREKGSNWLRENGLSKVADWLTTTGDKIKAAWEKVKEKIDPIASKIALFVTNAWGYITSLFEPTKEEDLGGYIDGPSPVARAINAIKNKIIRAYNSASKLVSPYAEKIVTFVTNAWGYITSLFEPTKEEDLGGYIDGPSPVEKAIRTIGGGLKSAWSWVERNIFPIAADIGRFISGTWNWLLGFITGSDNSFVEKGIDKKNIETVAYDFAETAKILDGVVAGNGPKLSLKNEVGRVARPPIGNLPKVQQTVEQTTSILERITSAIGNMVEKVKGWDGWDSVSSFFREIGTAISDMVKNIAEKGNVTKIFGLLQRTFDLIIAIIDKIISWGESLVSGNTASIVITVLGLIGGIVAKLVYAKWMSKLSGTDSLGNSMLKLAGSVFLIATAIAVLGSINEDTLLKGGGAVIAIGVVLGGLISLFAELKNAGHAANQADVTGWERLGNKLIAFGGIWLILQTLPTLIESISKEKPDFTGIFEFLGGLSTLIISLTAVSLLVGKFGGAQTMASGFLGIATAIIGLYGIATAIGFIASLDIKQTKKNLEGFATVMTLLGSSLGGFVGGMFGRGAGAYEGEKIAGMADGIGGAADAANDIDEAGLKKLGRVVSTLKVISENLPRNPTIFERWFSGKMSFEEFATQMTYFGEGISNFNSKVGTVEDPQKLIDSAEAIGKLVNAMIFLQSGLTVSNMTMLDQVLEDFNLGDFNVYEQAAEKIAAAINKGLDGEELKISGDPFVDAIIASIEARQSDISEAIYGTMQGALDDALRSDQNGSNTPDISDAAGVIKDAKKMASSFGSVFNIEGFAGQFESVLGTALGKIDLTSFQTEGMSAMQSFMAGVQEQIPEGGIPLTITPVIDSSSMPDWITSSGAMAITGKVSIEPSSLDTMRSTIVNQTTRTVNAIQVMTNRISYLEGAISRMSIILDTGVIAGAVNARLGSDIPKTTRRVTSGFSTAAHP